MEIALGLAAMELTFFIAGPMPLCFVFGAKMVLVIAVQGFDCC